MACIALLYSILLRTALLIVHYNVLTILLSIQTLYQATSDVSTFTLLLGDLLWKNVEAEIPLAKQSSAVIK